MVPIRTALFLLCFNSVFFVFTRVLVHPLFFFFFIFAALQALMMLNSYYLAIFAVYHIGGASTSSDWFWIILLPLPILCGTLMAYRRVIPLFSLLSAVVVLHAADVAHVSEA